MTDQSVSFFDTTMGKALRAVLYVAVSAAISGLMVQITETPNLFGVWTVGINGALVILKGALDPNTPNFPR